MGLGQNTVRVISSKSVKSAVGIWIHENEPRNDSLNFYQDSTAICILDNQITKGNWRLIEKQNHVISLMLTLELSKTLIDFAFEYNSRKDILVSKTPEGKIFAKYHRSKAK
jgi:hypothetical protein